MCSRSTLCDGRTDPVAHLERRDASPYDDEDVERYVARLISTHEFVQLLIAIGPIARPPVAECIAWRQRDAAGHLYEVSERLAVGVTVAEEVPVETIAFGTLQYPWPCALLARRHGEVSGIK